MPITAQAEAGTVPASTGLLERESERRELDGALEAARAGMGSLVVVEGAPGIGKSRLLGVTRERARADGMRVLDVAGLELEREFAFGLALRLLEPALDTVDAAHRRRLLADAPAARALFEGRLTEDLAGGVDRGYALVHGLRRLTVRLAGAEWAAGAPLLVCVDDAQWSDAPSLRFLAHLAAGVAALPLAITIATRDDGHGAPIELRHALAGAPNARVLRPRPLSEQAVQRLVQEVFPQAAPEFSQACAQATQGNPFYLAELLQSARADGMTPTARSAAQVRALLPESVARSVLLRVARLPDPAPALAAAAAVLGDGAALRHAAALADVDVHAAERAADALAAAHILRAGEPLVFTHSLIAAAVRMDLPAVARSRAHRRASELLRADDAPVEAVAAHLLGCRGDNDPAAVQTLRAAAARAAGQGDHRAAQQLLKRALAEPPPAQLRPDLEVELALTEAAVGTPDAVTRVRGALDAVQDTPRRIEVLRALARLLFARSQFDAAAETIGHAIDEVNCQDPLAGELLVDALATASLATTPAPVTRDRAQRLLADADAGRLPETPALLAQLAGLMLGAGRPATQVIEAARAALAGLPGDDGFYGVITGSAVVALIGVDDLDGAEAATQRALEHADQTGSLIAAGTASHWRAELRYHQGALADAIANAQHTLEICRAGWDMCRASVAPVLAHAHMDRGELDAAERALALVENSAGQHLQYALGLAARGRLALARGDCAGALEALLAAGERADRYAIPPTLLPWRSWASLTAARLGSRDLADALAQAELVRARTIGAPRTLGVALRAAGTARGGQQGLGLLAEAVAVLESSPSVLERARALVALGAALRRDGQRAAAREPLRRGLELAGQLGAQPLAARAGDELRGAGGRRRRHTTDPAALTSSERRIAQLAAAGLSTAQIAETLYVTAKTVDWHLGHIYQKLGINSRRQLAPILDGRRP
jgi:DNA-binding CsgD family transcriptional regulator